jgi:uncharacterized membrane protein YeaQ/YmgE (transglycosylase-associated protein family)
MARWYDVAARALNEEAGAFQDILAGVVGAWKPVARGSRMRGMLEGMPTW